MLERCQSWSKAARLKKIAGHLFYVLIKNTIFVVRKYCISDLFSLSMCCLQQTIYWYVVGRLIKCKKKRYVVGRTTNARILLKVKKCILSSLYKRKRTKFEVLIDATLRTIHVSLSEIKYPMCSGASCTMLGIYWVFSCKGTMSRDAHCTSSIKLNQYFLSAQLVSTTFEYVIEYVEEQGKYSQTEI